MEDKIELIKKVYSVIQIAAENSGRQSEDVRLVAVSKTKPVEEIIAFRRAGLREFGENYVQEFIDKFEQLKDHGIIWHFIGHLQRNKVKYIVDKAFMIHTVDSFELAEEIQKQAIKKELPKINILLQVNIGKEPQKGGIDPDCLIDEYNRIKELDRLKIHGLMSIPPFLEAESLRIYHRRLRELRDEILQKTDADPQIFKELSMGMSEDFDVAIEEGATIVRLGTILFGKREKKETSGQISN
ncbi:YggS family pyridoxal phosphate-dependent enzyme [bacterium]|nr:YggS family pyridoxal phosphate-dependent enzyme [bacterium]